MSGRIFNLRNAAGALALLIGGAFSGGAQAMCHSNFNCGMGSSPVCYFLVQQHEYGGVKRLLVPAGESRGMFGMHPGAEFCSSNQGWPEPGYCNYRPVRMSCD